MDCFVSEMDGISAVPADTTENGMSDSPPPDAPPPSSQWFLKAAIAAVLVFGAGMLLLGLPGAMVLEFVEGLGLARKLPPDSVWPLAIYITFAGAVLIVPMSLALHYLQPRITGWGHVWRTALLALAGTFVFAWLVAR
jgi:hypothetical protein